MASSPPPTADAAQITSGARGILQHIGYGPNLFFLLPLVTAPATSENYTILPSRQYKPEDSPMPSAAPVAVSQIPPSDFFDLKKTGFSSGVSTGPIRRDYFFNITRDIGSPDGVDKPMLLVNGQSPGPIIEANTGDILRVVVHNGMAANDSSTTIHWHGIDQRDTSWMDGVHGVTQCGIPPGESFTYEFTVAEQRGTFWYHSHTTGQYTDGLFGPLV